MRMVPCCPRAGPAPLQPYLRRWSFPVPGGRVGSLGSRPLPSSTACRWNCDRFRRDPSPRWRLDEHLDEVDLLVVIGGDGAMRLAADSATRRATAVYHYPAGTENLFARDHGMEASPERLFEAMSMGQPRRIDVARVGTELCLLCCSIGVDAEVTHDLAASRTGCDLASVLSAPAGSSAASLAAKTSFLRGHGRRASLGPARPGVVIVGNSRQYALRLDPVLDADNADGLLDVVQVSGTHGDGACALGPAVSSAKAVQLEGTSARTRTPDPGTRESAGQDPGRWRSCG